MYEGFGERSDSSLLEGIYMYMYIIIYTCAKVCNVFTCICTCTLLQ